MSLTIFKSFIEFISNEEFESQFLKNNVLNFSKGMEVGWEKGKWEGE